MIGFTFTLALMVSSVTVFGCSGVDAQEPGASIEALRSIMKSVIREEEITDGGFNEIMVGDSKDEVLEALKAMNVSYIKPDLKNRIRVTRPEDIERLRSAEGIIIGAGSAKILFDGDHVVDLWVAPVYPRWKELLEGAESREEVLGGLRRILQEDRREAIRNIAPESRQVLVQAIGEEEKKLLDRFDLWRVVWNDSEGYWALQLFFEKDRLQKIKVWHSKVEVP